MIRVSISSKNNQMIQQSFEQFFQKEHLEYCIVPYQKQTHQDIYIFEIQNKEDLQLIANHPYSPYSLYYVIGPEDYAITSECIRLKVDLYFSKQTFIKELEKYKDYILKDIQDKLQYYQYQRNGIISQIRLSHIYYVESLRHSIIIHSINGTMVERKNLKDIINELDSPAFIQVHKSFIINRNMIQKYNSKEVYLKDHTVIPLGRAYKNQLKEYETS